jgi:hypothetical protein
MLSKQVVLLTPGSAPSSTSPVQGGEKHRWRVPDLALAWPNSFSYQIAAFYQGPWNSTKIPSLVVKDAVIPLVKGKGDDKNYHTKHEHPVIPGTVVAVWMQLTAGDKVWLLLPLCALRPPSWYRDTLRVGKGRGGHIWGFLAAKLGCA